MTSNPTGGRLFGRRFSFPIYALIFLAVAAAYLAGWIDFVENQLIDQRFRLTSRPATGTIVVVAIDPKTIREVGTWPWPRRIHAETIDRLIDSGANSIAFDVDFSSASNPQDDRLLAEAIARSGGRVVLPAFKQFVPINDTDVRLVGTVPLPAFREHARLASINVRPENDSLVRTYPAFDQWGDERLPSVPAALADLKESEDVRFTIDFGIDPYSIPVYSLDDVLKGRVGASELRGKNVIIGATAVELGDQLAVPVYKTLPGSIVIALAYESLVQGRALQEIPPAAVLVVALVLAFSFGPLFEIWTWRRGFVATVLFAGTTFVLSWALQKTFPVTLDISPWFLVISLSYGAGMAKSIDRHALASFLFRREASHHKAVIRNLSDNTFDGILIVYDDGTLDFFNPPAERMFGYDASEVMGENIARLLKDADLLKAGAQEFDEGLCEATGIRKDGSTFPIDLAVSKIEVPSLGQVGEDGAARYSYMLTIRDVTERKKAEENARRQRQQIMRINRMQSMGSLASGLAHELGQPLNAIHILLYRAAEAAKSGTGVPETIGDDVAQAMQQAERAGEIVMELRRFVGKADPRRDPVQINDLVNEVIANLQYDERTKAVRLRTQLAEDLPPVSADRMQIEQVLVNLVRNGIDAMKGKLILEANLTVRTSCAEDGNVLVEVIDSGEGIPEEIMEQIFEPFYTSKDDGLGFGLAMCKSIVEEHGGDLAVESRPGRTRFHFELPPCEPTEDKAGAELSTVSG